MSRPPDARITEVRISGTPGAYTFAVTIASNDEGPQHYADWWEVAGEDGALLYRRVLLHDHAGEQPFTRDGGPVAIAPSTPVIVRAHVHPTGYSNAALRGTAGGGFAAVELAPDFASGLAFVPPLPQRR